MLAFLKLILLYGPAIIKLVMEAIDLINKLKSPTARDLALNEAVHIAKAPGYSPAQRKKRFKDFVCRLRNDCTSGL